MKESDFGKPINSGKHPTKCNYAVKAPHVPGAYFVCRLHKNHEGAHVAEMIWERVRIERG